MTRVAGEVADLVLCHAFTTADYLRQVTLPALADGAAAAGRDRGDVGVALGTFVVTGRDDEERAAVDRAVRSQLAFYASTPAYRRVLDVHGWGQLQTELNAMSKRGEWEAMARRIDDDMVEQFALVVDDPDEVGAAVTDRFGDHVDRLSLYPTWQPDAQALAALRAHLDRRQGQRIDG
jgi:probable F420-dependent oxidoreductase